jgi:hypothetical protein
MAWQILILVLIVAVPIFGLIAMTFDSRSGPGQQPLDSRKPRDPWGEP